jgi:hypothetical protein
VVDWHPLPFLPRLFDTVVMPFSGSTTIQALGFCAYTSQGFYTFYGTLPFNGSMTGPVNPDSVVTVTAGTQEYGLVSVRAEGDQNFFPLGGVPAYAGQTLNGPFTFKFYAARESFGAHGEMDVWFGADGTFPAYLRAGLYDSLVLSGTMYRKDASPADTSRNAYAVLAASDASLVAWPCVYVGTDSGRVVSVDVDSSGVLCNGTVFLPPTWQAPYPDPGLSYTIIASGAAVSLDSWLNGVNEPWLTDGNEQWTS